MPLNSLGLGFMFSAQDLASAKIAGLSGEFSKMELHAKRSALITQGSFVALGAGAAVLGAGVGTLLGALDVARTAGEFEKGIARVGVISGASAAQLEELSNAAFAARSGTAFTPTQSIEGLQELAAQGFNAEESMNAIRPALLLASAGGISVAESTSAMVSAFKVFGIGADQAGPTVDKLLKISDATSLSANELSGALGTVGRGASIANQSLEETLNAMGLVRNSGISAEVSASAVSSALLEMSQNADKFGKIGVKVVDPVTNKIRPLLDVIMETSTALEGQVPDAAARAAKATELFGRFGLTAFSAVSTQLKNGMRGANGEIVKGAEAIDFLRTSLDSAAGTADKFNEKVLSSFAGQTAALEASKETLKTAFGAPFAKALAPVVGVIIKIVDGITNAFRSLPKPVQKTIAGIVIAFGAMATGIGAFIAAGAGLALLIPFLKAIAITIGIMAIIFAPVVIAFAALTAGAAAFAFAVRNNIGGIGDKFAKAWEKVKLFTTGLMELFFGGGIRGETLSGLMKEENKGVLELVETVSVAVGKVEAFIEEFKAGFVEAMARFERVSPLLDKLWGAVKRLFGSLGDLMGAFSDVSASGKTTGKTFGESLVIGIELFIKAATIAVEMVNNLVRGFRILLEMSGVGPVGRLIGMMLEGGGGVATPDLESIRSAAAATRPPVSAGSPAVAQAELMSTSGEAIESSLESFATRMQQAPPIRVTANLHMDGEKIAQSVMDVERRNMSLAGVPISGES